MRKRIFLFYIILIITGMSITGFFVSSLAQSLYKDEVRHRLLTVASLFDRELSEVLESGGVIDYNKLAERYVKSLDDSIHEGPEEVTESRITVIDYDGNVLGESQTNYVKMDNHLNRKEVQRAIQGEIGENTRFSTTLKMDFLYIAVPSAKTGAIIRVSVPLIQLRKITMQIWLYCILGIVTGLALTALLAFRFANVISRPVLALTHASREIAGGNYSRRVAVSSNDELGQLAASFNGMADRLERTVGDLTDKNVQLYSILNSMTNCFVAVDSSMRIILANSIAVRFFGLSGDNDILGKRFIEVIRNHPINDILQKAIENNQSSEHEVALRFPEPGVFKVYASPIQSAKSAEANTGGMISLHDITPVKKLEQIRTEFVSNVTHELKTPLTSIRGFVETLRSGAVHDTEVADQFLEIIDIEAERLTMLINDILQLSEIESLPGDTRIGSFNLSSIISEVVSILQVPANKKNIRLLVEAAFDITIRANHDRIEQMLINLIDNAIKYNVEDGTVHVRAARSDGIVVISVADTGIGIEPQHLSRIFERFYRVDKGRSRSMGGTGLGLSIVKHIVQLYDGDIRVVSEPGKGTEFIVQLPV